MITLKEFVEKTKIRSHAISGRQSSNITFDFEDLFDVQKDFCIYLNEIKINEMKDIIEPFKTFIIGKVTFEKVIDKNIKILNVSLRRFSDDDIKSKSISIAKRILTNLYNHIIENLNIYPCYDEIIKLEI